LIESNERLSTSPGADHAFAGIWSGGRIQIKACIANEMFDFLTTEYAIGFNNAAAQVGQGHRRILDARALGYDRSDGCFAETPSFTTQGLADFDSPLPRHAVDKKCADGRWGTYRGRRAGFSMCLSVLRRGSVFPRFRSSGFGQSRSSFPFFFHQGYWLESGLTTPTLFS